MPQVTFNGTKINVEFTESSSRQQLNSGENISTLFGKIKKIFSDLKAVCFSGSYNDLSNKPSSLPANGGNADYAAVAHDTQLFNGKPSGYYVQSLGVVQVDDMSTAPADTYEYLNDSTYRVPYEVAISPLVSVFMGLPNRWWLIKYYIYGYGNGYSCQTAFPVGFGGVPYIRYSQEKAWSDWKEISTTPIKSTTGTYAIDTWGGTTLWFVGQVGTPIFAYSKGYYAPITPHIGGNDMNVWRLIFSESSVFNTSREITIIYF